MTSRTETFTRKVPGGGFATITRNLDTGEQTVTFDDVASVTGGDKDAPDVPTGTPSDDWKVPQLKAYAKEHGIDLDGARTKPDILATILTADDADDDEDDEDEDEDESSDDE